MSASQDTARFKPGMEAHFASNLSFNKEDFLKVDFNTDHFVIECRRRVSLETLRDDLILYLKMLQSSMIELINQDYADFVNLSSNLVGFDKAINNLSIPLGQLKEEVLEVQKVVESVLNDVEEKLKEQQEIKQRKLLIKRLIDILQSVEKIERLLGLRHSTAQVTSSSSELSGHLIERVATEFTRLQFLVNMTRSVPLVEELSPRIATITTSLQLSIERSFKQALDDDDVASLKQCLRTYSLIDKIPDAELLFRQHFVVPYMEQIISERNLQETPQGLRGVYAKILDFVPQKCRFIRDATGKSLAGAEQLKGFDFLVNSVWPEVVTRIETAMPSIYAPGNPNIFHEKYSTTLDFLEKFERICGSQASVKRLRAHQSYNHFMSKWSLPVYYQIRFQEIAGEFETVLHEPCRPSSGSLFRLHVTAVLHSCVRRCWERQILLPALTHRFWKLTLQLLCRFATWIGAVQTMVCSPGESEEADLNPAENLPLNDILLLIADMRTFSEMLPSLFQELIEPQLTLLGVTSSAVFTKSLDECASNLTKQIPAFAEYIVKHLVQDSCSSFKSVNDIPRLYRRTNRDIPSKPSNYVTNVYRPLVAFSDEHGHVIRATDKVEWFVAAMTDLTNQYHAVTDNVLTSVRKMEESLKRLKKGKGGSSANLSAQGMSDDDKIRLQLYLDVREFGEKMLKLGISSADVTSYAGLYDLVKAAKDYRDTSSN